MLHLQTLTEADRQRARQAAQLQAAQADQSLEATIRRYTVLVNKQQELERELQQVHDHLCRALAALPQRSVETEKGRFYLEMVDGIETLRWESAGE
ncbi:MAG: hypothetical protein KatS3mg111_0633 [Pirellulaceae bacterium]|nr:MAG: hypothetical protein KatS3mg111_0633 [Pirellulaceae bacterium]